MIKVHLTIRDPDGSKKEHKGFYSFDFDSPTGNFVAIHIVIRVVTLRKDNGKWTFIEFAFQSWSRDPVILLNSYGSIQLKPYFNPLNSHCTRKSINLFKGIDKKMSFPLAVTDDSGENYENISYSYLIKYYLGMVNYRELVEFFILNPDPWYKSILRRDVFKKPPT